MYKINKINKEITIDANPNKAIWINTPSLNLENNIFEKPEHFPKTTIKALYDQSNIYILFTVEDKYIKAMATENNGQVWKDSCVEFFFTPSKDKSDQYFNLETNCIGTILMEYHNGDLKKSIPDSLIEEIEIASSFPKGIKIIEEKVESEIWHIEYKLPIHILSNYMEIDTPKLGTIWNVNFYKCADNSSHPHFLCCNPILAKENINFHKPQYFGPVQFN